MRLFIIFLPLLSLFSCQIDEEEYLKRNRGKILRVISDASAVPADGKSVILISAFIPRASDSKTINFSTTSGKFKFSDSSSANVEATEYDENSLRAQTYLISSTETEDQILLKVSIASIDTTLQLKFNIAYADSVANESTVAAIKKGFGSEVPVKTTLYRKLGVPSQNQFISYLAFKSDKNTIGEFRAIDPNGTDSKGVINSIFVLKDTLYTGPIKIVSRYSGLKTYTDTLLVFVTK